MKKPAYALLLALSFLSVGAPLTAQPNVLVIQTDDQNVPTTNAGLAAGFWPNLQTHVISQGTTFTNAEDPDSLCCPSIASLLSGQYVHNHKVWSNGLPLGGVTVFNDSSTLATWLKARGYRTGKGGRYMTGYGLGVDPSPKDDPTYIPPGWDDWQVLLQPPPGSGGMYDYDLNSNGTIVHYGSAPADYQTDVVASRAVQFLQGTEASDSQPWFLYVQFTAPHWESPGCTVNSGTYGTIRPAPRHIGSAAGMTIPLTPGFNEANVSDKPTYVGTLYPLLTQPHIDCLNTVYRAKQESLRAVDDAIGSLFSTLTANGEMANTWTFVTTDNAEQIGEHRLNGKQFPYQESIRVPLYIRAPGYPAQTTTRFALNSDLAPTIVEIAGATAGLTMDGRSLFPVIANPNHLPWRKQIPLMVRYSETAGWSGVLTDTFASVPNEKYIEYTPTGEKEQYDLTVDPFELTSVHASSTPPYPGHRTWMAALLAQLKTCVGATCHALEEQP